MASSRPDIDEPTRAFLEKQLVFFVASAPLSGDGHVNLSPKGHDAFRVLSPTRVSYLDLGGSGNETSAHMLEPGNARLTLMFCSFDGSPRIVRLQGKGSVVTPNDPGWTEAYAPYAHLPGARQVVFLDVTRVGASCGYGVPLMEEPAEREILPAKRAARTSWYCSDTNYESIDGLPTHLASAGRTV